MLKPLHAWVHDFNNVQVSLSSGLAETNKGIHRKSGTYCLMYVSCAFSIALTLLPSK